METTKTKCAAAAEQPMWHGIPRRDIPWYPTIDPDRCIHCGLCYVTCGRMVFDMNEEKGTPLVAEPYRCMVGCSTCANICPAGAISFPDKSVVQKIEREHKILKVVKEEVRAKRARGDLEKARAAAARTVSAISPQVEFEVAGDFGDKRFVMQLYEFVKDRDCDITHFEMENPTLKGTIGGKAPSFCRFRLVSESYDDVDEHAHAIHDIIQANNLVLTNERKV